MKRCVGDMALHRKLHGLDDALSSGFDLLNVQKPIEYGIRLKLLPIKLLISVAYIPAS
jgi:hypothetical protein